MVGYALKSLFHQRLRLAISVLGIGIAIGLIIIISGFAKGFKTQASGFYRRVNSQIIVGENDEGMTANFSLLPKSLKKEIAATPGVDEVSEIMSAPLIYNSLSITLIGYEDRKLGGPWKLSKGRNIESENEIVLDEAFAKDQDFELGSNIKLLGNKFKIVGFSAETASFISSLNFISLKKIRQLTNTPESTGYFLIKTKNTALTKNSLEKNLDKGTVLTNQEMGEGEEEDIEQVMGDPINIVSVIAFLIGILVVALTAYVATLSKISEFGVLKAIGAKRSKLFLVVIKQSLTSTVLGLAAGIAIGYLTANVISAVWPKFLIDITPDSLMRISFLALIMAMMASLVPIRKVESVDPVLVFK